MIRHHFRSLFRDLVTALRGRGSWFEVKYHAYTLWSDIIHPARCVVYGLRNLYAYLPLIWHDRDWDYSSMLILWEKKFQRMAHLHLVHGHHLDNELTARDLRVCASLCVRIREDNYSDAAHKLHNEKWGKPKFVALPATHPHSTEMREVRFNVRNDKDREQERQELLAFIKQGEQQRNADVKYLGELISKKMLGWWD